MVNDTLEKGLLIEVLEEKDVDVSGGESLEELRDMLFELVESRGFDDDAEIEISVSANFTTTVHPESLSYGLDWDRLFERMTMDIADSGINRAGEVTDVELEEIWEF